MSTKGSTATEAFGGSAAVSIADACAGRSALIKGSGAADSLRTPAGVISNAHASATRDREAQDSQRHDQGQRPMRKQQRLKRNLGHLDNEPSHDAVGRRDAG